MQPRDYKLKEKNASVNRIISTKESSGTKMVQERLYMYRLSTI